MVVDSYTQRLVKELGFDFDEYEELKSWCKCGINDNFDKIKEIYNKDIEVHEVYALFHGMIVDFCKDNAKGKSIDITNLR
jgi:endonuclease-3 related protein